MNLPWSCNTTFASDKKSTGAGATLIKDSLGYMVGIITSPESAELIVEMSKILHELKHNDSDLKSLEELVKKI